MRKFKQIAIGLLIGGSLTALLAGISLATVEQERKISGLGDAAFLDDCKLEAVGDLLGFTPTRSVSGGAKNCDDPEPLDVQEDVSTAALTLGGVSIAFGGIILLISYKRPNLLETVRLKNIFSKLGNRQSRLDSQLRSLDKLRKDGLLTDSEFQAQKKRLLGE
jgi:hypothetical protein